MDAEDSTFESVDDHIDFIFAIIDRLCQMGNWTLIDAMLAGAEVEKMGSYIACAYASITHAPRKDLPSRLDFIKRCRKAYPRKKLWDGFDKD